MRKGWQLFWIIVLLIIGTIGCILLGPIGCAASVPSMAAFDRKVEKAYAEFTTRQWPRRASFTQQEWHAQWDVEFWWLEYWRDRAYRGKPLPCSPERRGATSGVWAEFSGNCVLRSIAKFEHHPE